GPATPSGGGGVGPPGGGGPSGDDPRGGGNPNDPNNPMGTGGTRSSMGISRRGRAVHFNIELALTEKAYDKIYAISEGAVVRMKGMVDMADTHPRWHELAAAAKALPQDGIVPRATFARDEALNARIGRTFPP